MTHDHTISLAFLVVFPRSGLDGRVPPKSSLPTIFRLLCFVYWKHRKEAISVLKKAGFEMATGSSQDVLMMSFFFFSKSKTETQTDLPLDFCRKDLTGRGNRSSRGRGWAWEIQYFLSRSNSFSLPLSSIPLYPSHFIHHTDSRSPHLCSGGGNHSLTSHLTGIGKSPCPQSMEEPRKEPGSGFLDCSLVHGSFCQSCQFFLLIRLSALFFPLWSRAWQCDVYSILKIQRKSGGGRKHTHDKYSIVMYFCQISLYIVMVILHAPELCSWLFHT